MRRWLPTCPLILAIWLAGSIGQAAVAPRQFAAHPAPAAAELGR